MPTPFTPDMKATLAKLGEAFYIHKSLIKQAQKAATAVDYLKSKGVKL